MRTRSLFSRPMNGVGRLSDAGLGVVGDPPRRDLPERGVVRRHAAHDADAVALLEDDHAGRSTSCLQLAVREPLRELGDARERPCSSGSTAGRACSAARRRPRRCTCRGRSTSAFAAESNVVHAGRDQDDAAAHVAVGDLLRGDVGGLVRVGADRRRSGPCRCSRPPRGPAEHVERVIGRELWRDQDVHVVLDELRERRREVGLVRRRRRARARTRVPAPLR